MMKTKRFLSSVLFIGLLLVLAGSIVLTEAQGPDIQPQGDTAIAATVGSKISYQGVLKENGNPVTGSRDMTFRFYSDDTCSTQVGGDIIKTGVQVTDGFFDVNLDVNTTYFNGTALWLAVEVNSTQIGCQEILPVPYALSLRPGARVFDEVAGANVIEVRNTSSTDLSTALKARTTASSGEVTGLWGETSSPYGRGVYGKATSTTAGTDGRPYAVYGYSVSGTGVYGKSDANIGTGVVGEATDASGNNFGVRGLTYSSGGTGVYGWANGSAGANGMPYGVSGHSDNGYGVRGDSLNNVGVMARSASGNIIEAWDSNPVNNRRWYVSNSGNVYADGNFNSGGADFAEMLPATEEPGPGDVLIIGSDGRLTISSTPYDAKVVGVYSTKPGFIGGSGDDIDNFDDIPVAIVGVVPVKAVTKNGPIAPGDLLVTSSMPGYAMNAGSNPPVGTVIGKALEALNEGSGVIKMLVMLQ